jgi:capsular polysaccharide transport system ATP-binding protein
MIIFDRVEKIMGGTGARRREVLADVSLRIPSNRRIAVLGPSGRDKRVFMKLLAGIEFPTSGTIVRNARVSFPVGKIGGFSRDLSVRGNVAHVARLYDADVDAVVDFVKKVMRLGAAFDRPYREMPARKREDFSQVLSYSVPFDVYLLGEEVAAIGKRKEKSEVFSLFEARARTCGMIMATSNPGFVREFCDMALILHKGNILLTKDVEGALAAVAKIPAEDRPGKRPEKRKRRAEEDAED